MDSDRIQEIHEGTAYPESRSVQEALFQVWREVAQDTKLKGSDWIKLLASLNDLWGEELSHCCTLPCTDRVCRDLMAEEGGCYGAEFAEKLMEHLRS